MQDEKFNDTTVDAKLGTGGAFPQNNSSPWARKDAVELAIRMNSTGVVSAASKIVSDADVIYNYIIKGELPTVQPKDQSSFTVSPKGS